MSSIDNSEGLLLSVMRHNIDLMKENKRLLKEVDALHKRLCIVVETLEILQHRIKCDQFRDGVSLIDEALQRIRET